MKTPKGKVRKGYVVNCFIKPKLKEQSALVYGKPLGETLFRLSRNGFVVASLDGYAIVPLEEYKALVDAVKQYNAKQEADKGSILKENV